MRGRAANTDQVPDPSPPTPLPWYRGEGSSRKTETTMRYAICNETFEGWDHADVCRCVAELGYQGLELAPFTLAPRITDVPPARRRELRRQAEDHGLTLLGLHWLLAKTTGLQLTSPDAAVRQATADYLVELARCCHELGGDLMVFGSPAQRRIPAGATKSPGNGLCRGHFPPRRCRYCRRRSACLPGTAVAAGRRLHQHGRRGDRAARPRSTIRTSSCTST